MREIFLFFFFFVVINSNIIAGDDSSAGGRSAALAGSSSSLKGFWSVYNNQAGIASLRNFSGGISYENRFLLKELSTKYAAIIIPVKSGAFGLSISSYGFTLYNKKKIGLAYARKFGKFFSAGVQIDYIGFRIGNEYGKKDLFTFECGIQARLSKELIAGLHVFNPLQIKLSDQYDERTPAIIKLGISYSFSNKILSIVEFEKNTKYNALLRLGIEYMATKAITFRIGLKSNPFINSFGAGFKFGKLTLDISTSYHQNLGFISTASIIYELKSNEKH